MSNSPEFDRDLLLEIRNEQAAQRSLLDRVASKLGLLGTRQETERLIELEEQDRADRSGRGVDYLNKLSERGSMG